MRRGAGAGWTLGRRSAPHVPNGTVIVISSRQAVRRDDDGRPTAVIELNWDITEPTTPTTHP